MRGRITIPQKIPFSVSGFPVFYGWIILMAGTVGIIMSIPGQTMGVSVFTEHLKTALHLSNEQLSFAYMIGTLLSTLLLTRAGRFYDVYGARIMTILASVMLAITLIYITKIDILIQIISKTRLLNHVTIITSFFMIIGFFGIRFFGQGIITMTSRNMVMKWFDKRRGFANSIMGAFVSFGFSYSPKLFNNLIDLYQWKGAWTYIAIAVGVFFLIFAFVFFRDNPEECGLIPDGKKINQKKNRPLSHPSRDYSLSEAKNTYSFWIFNLALTMNGLYITALTFWVVSLFNQAGFSDSDAVSIFLPASFVAVFFHFTGSWLSDYFKLKYFLIVNIIGMLISTTGLFFLNIHPLAKIFIISGNGIISGMFGVLSAITWPRFFGTKHLGEISGYAMSWLVFGSAIGPFLFSLSLKYIGSYNPGIVSCFAISLILLILAFKAENVNEKA